MTIKLEVIIDQEQTVIQSEEHQLQIEISTIKEIRSEKPVLYFLLKEKRLIAMGDTIKTAKLPSIESDELLVITPSWEIELNYLGQILMEKTTENGLVVENYLSNPGAVPKNIVPVVSQYQEIIGQILTTFGYSFESQIEAKSGKPKSAKTQYRWRKEISQIEFTVNFRGGTGRVIWQKRNEMLLKTGAKLLPVAPLNKDGSVGFAAKMGEKIRSEHQDKIKDFVTTEDIILKSVNEIGLFLYFGGTNSWLELLDGNGKSLYEWAKID